MSAIPEPESVAAEGSSTEGFVVFSPIRLKELGAEGNLALSALEYWERYADDPMLRRDCEHVLGYIRTLHAQVVALAAEVPGLPRTAEGIWDAAHAAGWNDAQNDRNGHPRRITPNPFRGLEHQAESALDDGEPCSYCMKEAAFAVDPDGDYIGRNCAVPE